MTDIRAFVVGVARYGVAWDANSAARNAYAIIRMLLLDGTPAEHITAFIDPEGLSDRQRLALARHGVVLRSTQAVKIDHFWRSELPGLIRPGSKIFAYWSGHGATDEKQNRIFYCRDYSETFSSQVFNATEFLAHLRSGRYAVSTEQMFFADVCGTYSDNPLSPTDSRPDAADMREVDQLSIFASPDGAYANSEEYGAFTSVLTKVMAEFRGGWPSSDDFVARLKPAVARADQRPFWIRWSGKYQSEPGEQLIGRANGYVKAMRRLLAPYPLAGDIFERPYRQTIRNLRVEPLLPNYDLDRLVDALSQIDDNRDSGPPFALVQFLERLSREASLDANAKAAITAWIRANTPPQIKAEIDKLLATERRRVRLLIDIANDRTGAPTTAQAQLVEMDGWPVAGFTNSTYAVKSDEGLLEWIAQQVKQVIDLDGTARPEVHFLVDPPLFRLPFHKTSFEDFSLGSQFDCILHYRLRAQNNIRAQPERWEDWARAMQGVPLDRLELLRIDSPPAPIPDGAGICLAGFAHGPLAHAQEQVRRLTELLVRGAPYVCWPVDATGIAGADVRSTLETMIVGAAAFYAIPDKIRERRLDGCAIANELAVLWDDPKQRPLPMATGVTR